MIDVETARSPGWWLQRLVRKLAAREDRLVDLRRRFDGDAPLSEIEGQTEAFRRFRKKARTNYAELIVEATRERMIPLGFRTAADSSSEGDPEARRVWDANDLDVEFPEVLTDMLSLGDGYVIVSPDVDPELGGVPNITHESPFQVVTEHDPLFQRRILAGLKLYHDDVYGEDLAFLYLSARSADDDVMAAGGELWVAHRSRKARAGRVSFSAQTWEWDEERFAGLNGMPVIRFRNKRGVGEYEKHVDLLDRLDHQVYQRMAIATMQAFKQMAIKGLPFHDEKGDPLKQPSGQPVDLAYYSELFVRDPGAFWSLPETAEVWESGQVDLTPLSTIDKDDLAKVAAVTRTPMATLMPGDGSDSAEGATFKREGLIFKVGDRLVRARAGVVDVLAQSFRSMGDEVRAERGQIDVIWQSPERRSLAEKASASAQAGDDLPWETKMSEVWGFTPKQIDRMRAERAADALMMPVAPSADVR